MMENKCHDEELNRMYEQTGMTLCKCHDEELYKMYEQRMGTTLYKSYQDTH